MAEALIFCIITDLFAVKMYKNTKNDKKIDIIYKFLVTFQTYSSIVYQKWEENSKMSKKEGKGLKSFNKGFQVPDTYIIIFLVVVVAALLTFLVPKGFYETQDISYMINGVEKTRTVIKDGSFQYLTDDAGNVVTEGVALFSGDVYAFSRTGPST